MISKFAVKPGAACYKQARGHQVTAYARLQTLAEMRTCLADGYPFVFGFSVFESFESQKVAQTGVVSMPKTSEKMLGGHAVLGVGYEDASKRFLVRNSWGTDWGMKGYFTMPYDYLDDRNLSDDFWTIRAQEGFYQGSGIGHSAARLTTDGRDVTTKTPLRRLHAIALDFRRFRLCWSKGRARQYVYTSAIRRIAHAAARRRSSS